MTKPTASSSPTPSPAGSPMKFRQGFRQWIMGGTRLAHWARVFLRLVLFVVVVAVFGMAIGWVFRTRKLGPAPPSPFQGRQISFDLTLLSVDPLVSGGTMSFGWNIINDSCYGPISDGDDDDGNSGYDYNSAPRNTSCPTVNIYMDTNLFASTVATPTVTQNNSIPGTPIFQFIPKADLDWRSNEVRFETNLAMWARGHKLYSTLLNYPFDQYWGNIFIYAQVNGTEEPVGLSIGHTDGVAVGYDASFQFDPRYGYDLNDFNEQNKKDGSLYLIMYIRRTVLVRAYVVTLVIAMWLITLLLFAIAVQGTFFGYDVEVTILAAPVATLFAFTTLRTALPGAPGTFGAIIDFVGTLPSLAVLIGIAVLCLIHVLVNLERKRKPESKPQSSSHE